jgi:hypothetical protein
MGCSVPWTKQQSADIKRSSATVAWSLLVLASMVLIR